MSITLEEPTTNVFGGENLTGLETVETVKATGRTGTQFTPETAKIAAQRSVVARKLKRPDRALLQAINENFEAPELIKLIKRTLQLAEEQKSPKAMLEVIKLIIAYQVGQPVQRSVTFTTKFEDMLAEVMGNPVEGDVQYEE